MRGISIAATEGAGISVSTSDDTVHVEMYDANDVHVGELAFDANHAEALETALRAARLELHARAVGR